MIRVQGCPFVVTPKNCDKIVTFLCQKPPGGGVVLWQLILHSAASAPKTRPKFGRNPANNSDHSCENLFILTKSGQNPAKKGGGGWSDLDSFACPPLSSRSHPLPRVRPRANPKSTTPAHSSGLGALCGFSGLPSRLCGGISANRAFSRRCCGRITP